MYAMKKEDNVFNHFTGFSSYTDFSNVLHFVLPDLDRKHLVYWRTSQAKASFINTEKLFNDSESDDPDADNDLNLQSLPSNHSFPMTRVVSHLLPIESEFLITQMEIRMGLSNLDLAERFDISEGKVTNTLSTWITYLYLILGSLKIWPDRKVIIDNSPEEVKKKFPTNIVISDATELKVQVPSALQKHSETFRKYKSHTTFKSLIGVY